MLDLISAIAAVLIPSAAAADIPGGPTTTASLVLNAAAVSSDLSSVGDSDWFRVSLDAGKLYAVGMFGYDGGAMLRLRDSNGRIIASSELSFDGAYAMTDLGNFKVTRSGSYFLDVTALDFGQFRTRTDYDLWLEIDESTGFADAKRIVVGTRYNGKFNADLDLDCFVVALAAGRKYKFTGPLSDGMRYPGFDIYDRNRVGVAELDPTETFLTVDAVYSGDYYACGDDAWSDYSILLEEMRTGGGGATPGNDVITGTPGPDSIDALAGNDTVRGLGGDDNLGGGPGNDTLYDYGRDAGVMQGEAGDDVIHDGLGADPLQVVDGGDGQDQVLLYTDFTVQNRPRLQVDMGLGQAQLQLPTPVTFRLAGAEDLQVYGFGVTYYGTPGNDRIGSDGTGAMHAEGRAGDDYLIGTYLDDFLDGGPGIDTALPGRGTDTCLSIESIPAGSCG